MTGIMYTDTEIEELRALAEKWQLSGRELLADPEAGGAGGA